MIERLYSSSGDLNDRGQYAYYGRVGGCLITGNEDGAKHCAMNILYSLQHLGYVIPPQADAAWLGEAGPGPSYRDEGSGGPENDFTNRNTTFMTWNLLHLARMLKDAGGWDESYTYGIGHFIGMEVHEHGDYVGPLMPGMVLAIEQGAVVNGTRVAFEDDVLVTNNGHEWLTRFIPIEIDEVEALLEATHGDDLVSLRDRALLELVYGQLLMGRKLSPAGEHLARGFRLAVPWLSSAGYFELVRRHERLDCLRLTDTPAPPQGLAALLAEAAVVQRLQTGGRGRRPNEHRDTVG